MRAQDDRCTVLLVEDDAWLRSLLAAVLADEGYAVLEAGSGRQGCRMAREQGPDAILLDLGLPWRSGLEVLKDLRGDERTGRTPVLLMTGSIDLAHEAAADGAPVQIPKPLDLENLLARLDECRRG